MKDKSITAALVIAGFALTMGIAWHQGAFGTGDEQTVARAPVRLTDPMKNLPFAGQVRLAEGNSEPLPANPAPAEAAGAAQPMASVPPPPMATAASSDQPMAPPSVFLPPPTDGQLAADQQPQTNGQPPVSPEDAPPQVNGDAAAANDGAQADPVPPEERETRRANRQH